MPVKSEIWAKEIADRIRAKITDLNDELTLAALAEVDVEVMVTYSKDKSESTRLSVWCSQEV